MNKLPLKKRAQIIGLLVEGNSLRATSRLADCSINTVTKLLVDVGEEGSGRGAPHFGSMIAGIISPAHPVYRFVGTAYNQ